MYLHLGQNVVVTTDSIVGIFDLDNSTWSHITRKFLRDAERNSSLINVSEDIPKSFIICAENELSAENTVYLSQLSSLTLLKRVERGERREESLLDQISLQTTIY